jgi:hypothetical protein
MKLIVHATRIDRTTHEIAAPRSWDVVRAIVERCGSPELAAVDRDGLTPEEYLMASSDWREVQ